MNEVALPPSPNWYLNNILACSRRGTLAWGAKNFIVIAKQDKDNSTFQYSIIKDLFRDKVVSLKFSYKLNPDDSDDSELLIIGGDDRVKIWNVDSSELVMQFLFDDGGKPIVGVDWSVKDNLVYAVNSDGLLIYCNIQYKTTEMVSLGKLTTTSLACCPHDTNLVAVGAKNGLIYIVRKGIILYRMRGHNEEVVSLSWCPSDMNILSGNDKRDLLLASGAKDRSVFIWRAGSDGRYEYVINIPNVPLMGTSQHRSKLSSTVGTWIAVCWATSKLLLTSSVWGELLLWDLSTLNKDKPMHKIFHTYHGKGLFCIVASHDDTSYDNWRTDFNLTVWTLAQDRWIIRCRKSIDNLAKSTILEYKIPTQGGFVYCMGACPIDTSRIVFGTGDAMLRLWNLSEPHTTAFDIITHWQKIKGKIRAISWFPEDESTVAFGTGEGRIGIFDAIGTNKPPLLYRQYHRNTVYKIEWAQLESDYYLFSCAEGELVAYKKSTPNDVPKSIIKEGCTEFSWKSNMCLAIALENGSIMFYNQKLKKCGDTIHILRSTVNCLVWHPDSTVTDQWRSPLANYLAVASDSHSIIICDMSELIKELKIAIIENHIEDNENKQERKMHKIVATLNGHSDKVVCLAWSPHVSGHLVSGSYDNVAQVWNVEKAELIGTYIGHDGPVLCCMWSPLKPQLIMTGSSDFMLRIWDYTVAAQSPKEYSDIKTAKKKYKQQKNLSKVDDSEVHNNLTASTNRTNQSVEIISPKPLTLVPKKKENKSYFIKYNRILNDKTKILDFIRNEIRHKEQIEENSCISNISLFCEQQHHFLALVSNEKSAQKNLNSITEMNMWCNDLENNLIKAAEDHQLNDFLVSLAPSVSIKLWREMCEAYAHQLIKQCNVEKAVSYLLCIHKIYEAIEVFLNIKMYKEAYALARCKLDADDPFLKKILGCWAEKATFNGHLEQAAHCHMKLEQFDKAAKLLARRKDVYSLEIASELAFLNGDEGYGTSLAVDAMTRALMKSDWSKARSLITSIRKVQYLNIHIDIHEAIMSTHQNQNEIDTIRIWFNGMQNNGILQSFETKYDTSYYNTLLENGNTNIMPEHRMNDVRMQLNITYQIAMAITCDVKETQLKHLTVALDNILQYENMAAKHGALTRGGFFIHVLIQLDARKPMDKDSIYAKGNYPVSQSIRAYLCFGLLNWLLNYVEKLSIEEETHFVQLIIDLLDDAINEITLSWQDKICKLRELKGQLNDSVRKDNNFQKIDEEIQKLELDQTDLGKERVCIPNPNTIFHTACLVANKLRDCNQFKLFYFLHKLVEMREIKTSELETNLLKKLENISHVMNDMFEKCTLEEKEENYNSTSPNS